MIKNKSMRHQHMAKLWQLYGALRAEAMGRRFDGGSVRARVRQSYGIKERGIEEVSQALLEIYYTHEDHPEKVTFPNDGKPQEHVMWCDLCRPA